MVPGPIALQLPASQTLAMALEHVAAEHTPRFPDHSVPLPLSTKGKVRFVAVPGDRPAKDGKSLVVGCAGNDCGIYLRNTPDVGVGIIQKHSPFARLHALPRVQFALLRQCVTLELLYPADPETRLNHRVVLAAFVTVTFRSSGWAKEGSTHAISAPHTRVISGITGHPRTQSHCIAFEDGQTNRVDAHAKRRGPSYTTTY